MNAITKKSGQCVKYSNEEPGDFATAKGGIGLAEILARRTGLWSDCERILPARRDPSQGYSTVSVAAAAAHGMLCGGQGFSCTEPMRGDAPLLKMLGLPSAPSAETVEGVVKYLAAAPGSQKQLNLVLTRQAQRMIKAEKRNELISKEGWFEVWGDGSLLEVTGKNFESVKTINSSRGQMAVALFAGPYMAATDFADEGEGEHSVTLGFLKKILPGLLAETGLREKTLLLLDSLYGDGKVCGVAEDEGLDYIIGANKLVTAQKQAAETPEALWRDTGPNPRRGWSESGATSFMPQCADWDKKRRLVVLRFKKEGDMIWHYSCALTNIERDDERMVKIMGERKLCYEQAVFALYARKQARENQWKDTLCDMGLHHPPSAKVRANAIFYAIGAMACNLAVGLRRLAFPGKDSRMRLWRMRREVFDLPARVSVHARTVTARLLDARRHLAERICRAVPILRLI